MNYLLDTNIFLWSIFSPEKISREAKSVLIDTELTKNVSLITFWEISLKFAAGKIFLSGIFPDELPKIAEDARFEILNLDSNTVSSFYKLPKLKDKDPFDRMLAWQAISGDYYLLTNDEDFIGYYKYGLNTLW